MGQLVRGREGLWTGRPQMRVFRASVRPRAARGDCLLPAPSVPRCPAWCAEGVWVPTCVPGVMREMEPTQAWRLERGAPGGQGRASCPPTLGPLHVLADSGSPSQPPPSPSPRLPLTSPSQPPPAPRQGCLSPAPALPSPLGATWGPSRLRQGCSVVPVSAGCVSPHRPTLPGAGPRVFLPGEGGAVSGRSWRKGT